MGSWFNKAFGTAGQAVAEARHEILGAWFGRNFEPYPQQAYPASRDVADPSDRDIQGNERGIDR